MNNLLMDAMTGGRIFTPLALPWETMDVFNPSQTGRERHMSLDCLRRTNLEPPMPTREAADTERSDRAVSERVSKRLATHHFKSKSET
jgi:hypothetical protein